MRIEKMKRWVIAIVLLCGLCHTGVFAYGYDKDAQSKSWGYQPVYKSGPSMSAYQFRTTSIYIVSLGEAKPNIYSPTPDNNAPQRAKAWGEEGNPVGEVDDPAPIGDAPWWFMLLLATGYIAFRQRKVKHMKNGQFVKM